jgi:hypothetical protein
MWVLVGKWGKQQLLLEVEVVLLLVVEVVQLLVVEVVLLLVVVQLWGLL